MSVLTILLITNTFLLGILFFKSSRNNNTSFKNNFDRLEKNQERTERLVREEMANNRKELLKNLNVFNESLLSRIAEASTVQKNQLDSFAKQLASLTQMNAEKLEKVRDVVDKQLSSLQEDNKAQLEKMRATVDEKLHATLEKRLGESFKLVSDRLEKVHQGLGEMQNLASGVGDLKKVLTNVKTRGIWGEIQLGNLLEQILTPDQYEQNVITKKRGRDSVEFAVKLPGRNDQDVVYIPIDAKFPKEDYERLLAAQEQGDLEAIEESGKAIESRIKLEARKIRDKYLDPPQTTDFAILYLPTEGLYAEVLRRVGLCEQLQREFRIIISGPTTISALLNSLQMGFRTLAVEKRSSEVWKLLGVVKTEFGKFGDILEKTNDKLKEASRTMEKAASKSRNIERKLKKVQELPSSNVSELEGDALEPAADETAIS
ncbi:DNA recombination protein RmuC [hydrothermal vent metagenome]|uniref:DNA recombination protein RmuC n=1 Tax=hydrothermal vent metagenome TaxID=652676 RepID=A0A3B1E0U0_9ZZZZ